MTAEGSGAKPCPTCLGFCGDTGPTCAERFAGSGAAVDVLAKLRVAAIFLRSRGLASRAEDLSKVSTEVAAMIARENERDIDSVALDVARRFTPDDNPQRRARLQRAIIDSINKDRLELIRDEENHATAMVMVAEVLGLDLPCAQHQVIGKISSLLTRTAELEAERDALRAEAERYRWLRGQMFVKRNDATPDRYGLDRYLLSEGIDEEDDCRYIDAAIDAARAEAGHVPD